MFKQNPCITYTVTWIFNWTRNSKRKSHAICFWRIQKLHLFCWASPFCCLQFLVCKSHDYHYYCYFNDPDTSKCGNPFLIMIWYLSKVGEFRYRGLMVNSAISRWILRKVDCEVMTVHEADANVNLMRINLRISTGPRIGFDSEGNLARWGVRKWTGWKMAGRLIRLSGLCRSFPRRNAFNIGG